MPTVDTLAQPDNLVDNSNVSSVPLLTKDNFSEWHDCIEAFKLVKDLDGIVDGIEPVPSTPTLLTAYHKRCKFLVGFLLPKMGPQLQQLLVNDSNKKDPIALWRHDHCSLCFH
ncbi:hypothetical protein CROQUDRAFT_91705 [Cronartium quercuum f. sp. fusiforme G11]|uniref:Retrotransposon Copia-like N-terminal domain-containing protein n=1 Tax=Cronartium quercuum f. sp. fusiforme G11 TaxID=708437 RepID=A0A9P6TE00_9BASI|nr:hypothetical protein CROQUDRAFT_91705 [Cronartium quercuum f. sp. fusiforme G11]